MQDKKYTSIIITLLIHVLLLFCLLYRWHETDHSTMALLAPQQPAPHIPTVHIASVQAAPAASLYTANPPQSYNAMTIPNTSTAESTTSVTHATAQPAQEEPSIPIPSNTTTATQTTTTSALSIKRTAQQSAPLLPQASAANIPVIEQHAHHKPRLPTLAEVTNYCLSTPHIQGKGRITVQGDAQRTPSNEDLEKHRYIEKLLTCMHISAETVKKPAYTGNQEALVQIQITRAGILLRPPTLITSCGNNIVDMHCIELLVDASQSFPPLPKVFKEPVFTLLIHMIVSATGNIPRLYAGRSRSW
jgi:hypothetical protein